MGKEGRRLNLIFEKKIKGGSYRYKGEVLGREEGGTFGTLGSEEAKGERTRREKKEKEKERK